MKLLNLSFTKPRYLLFGLAIAAAGGTAQAQSTGIGTVAPTATLHVTRLTNPADLTTIDTTGAGKEIIRIDGVKNLANADKPNYGEVLVYNSATGLFRRESVADLLDDNGEWVWDAATSTLRPRRSAVQNTIAVTATGIGVTGTAAVSGNTTVGGTLAVTGNGTFAADLTVNGNTALATGTGDVVTLANLTRIPLANVGPGIHVMIRDTANANQVRYSELGDLLEANGMWVENAAQDTLRPRLPGYASTIGVGKTLVHIRKNADVDGTFNADGASTFGNTVRVTGATDLDATLNVDGQTTLNAVPQVLTPAQADKVLLQTTADNVVRHVRVDSLVQQSGEWRYNATQTAIYANRARQAGNNIVATTAGNFGIGTAAPSDKLQIVGGGIDLDANQSLAFGSIGTLAGNGTNMSLSATGALAITSTGVSTIQGNGGPVVTFNQFGVGIGVVAANGRVLHTNSADGLQFGSLGRVTDVSTQGTTLPAVANDFFDRVLITDEAGVVRYIDADDLVSSSSEWVFDDVDDDGVFDVGEKVYVRRLGNDGSGDDVYIDAVGNMVLSGTKAYQFEDDQNEVTATGITASAAYTIELAAGLTVNTGSAQNVGFFETGAGNPWLFFSAADAGNDKGRVGIGTNTPLASLHVQGNIIASHTAQTSDKRFKKDIAELTGALDAIKALRGVSYSFRRDEFPQENFDDAAHIGFIAQELKAILPQAVFERGDGYYTVDYNAVTPVLVEAVQELSAKVERLEAENTALRGNKSDAVGAVSTKQLQELEARLAAMDARLEAATAGRK